MTTALTARAPEDLLAVVPIVLGFHPSDSLVMLTFDGDRTFHARMDLPPPDVLPGAIAEVVEALLSPALAQRVGRVAFISYTDDAPGSALLGLELRRVFGAQGIEVVTTMRVHAGTWRLLPSRPGRAETGPTPYDDATHPFAVQAVLDGLVTHASRDDLRASVAASPPAVARIAEQQAREAQPPASQAWVLRVLDRAVATRVRPGDIDAARVLQAVLRWEVRDAVLFAVTRDLAVQHLEVWADLLRRAPERQVPDAAAVTAFCAWQVGQGALAWCAVDRCLEVDPQHQLGRHLAACLAGAVPPTAWEAGSSEATRRPRATAARAEQGPMRSRARRATGSL